MSDVSLPSKREFMLGAAAAAAGALPIVRAKRARAATLKPLRMTIDYVFQGPNGCFAVAREKGYYEAVGLDVTVKAGKGGGNTAQLVASGASDFGFADSFVVGNGVAKGMGIRMVAAIYRKNPLSVLTLSSSGIKSPKDLEGKTVGLSAGGGSFQQWPAYVKGCNLDLSKIRVVNLDPAGLNPALITGRVDAILVYAQSSVPAIEVQAHKTTSPMYFADCKVNVIGNGMIVRDSMIKSDPETVRNFVTASLKGFLYAGQHPDEAAAIVNKYDPNTNIEINKRQLVLSLETWNTPNTIGKPLGWMSDIDWRDTISGLKSFGGLTTPLSAEDCYTNDFIPSGTEFVPTRT